MTPKEKAKELYSKYEFVYIQNYTSSHEVKQCALIAVDEIINDQNGDDSTVGNKSWWWNEVKKEIEAL